MNRIKGMILCLLCVFLLVGCSGDDDKQIKSGYKIYYVNSEENNVVVESYHASSKDTEEMIEEFLNKLEKSSDSMTTKSAKPKSVELKEHNLKDGKLSLKFSSEYEKMSNTTEVLMRMTYVKTLIQIPGVELVDFYVEEQPLEDSNGQVIGSMNAETFVDNSGGQVNDYEEADIILYYANEDGDKLKQTMKSIVYNQNIPLEKVVIEQLIKGPASGKGFYPTLPAKTKLISVTINDSICYVNFDEEFLKLENEVSEEVQIYSVVNSLAELPTVSKVQISINGVTDRTFVDNIDFNTVFERNLDIIEGNEEEEVIE